MPTPQGRNYRDLRTKQTEASTRRSPNIEQRSNGEQEVRERGLGQVIGGFGGASIQTGWAIHCGSRAALTRRKVSSASIEKFHELTGKFALLRYTFFVAVTERVTEGSMKRFLLVIGLLLAWSIGASCFFAGKCLFNGTCGVFLRAFIGYTLIIALSHFFYLFLPRFGLGSDPRTE